jgi:hypothetical protein
MVADNVKNFEVVLADSRIVNANANTNSDLFTVLKGGGPNFGIVTRYDLYTKPDYKLWYTTKAYSTDNAAAVMTAAVAVERNMVEDDKAGFFLTTTPNSLVAGMLYRDWVESRPTIFAPFDNIMPISVVVPETNGTEESSALAQTQDQKGKRAIGTVSLQPDADLYLKTLGILQELASTTPNIRLVHTFQPLGAPSVAKTTSLGGNLLNVQPVSQSWLAVAAFWTDDAYNTKGVEQTQTLVKRIKSATADAGKLLEFEFMNDSNFAQSPLKHYGEVSISLMKKAAAKYDPNEIFQTLQNNGFLLSNIDQGAVLGESNKPARRSTPLQA